MAKKYKLVEDKEDDGGGLIIVLILLVVLFFLAPGIFISSLINFLIPLEGRIIWAIAIICSLSILGYLYFNYNDEMFIIYLWICGIVAILLLILTLIIPNNIFLTTLKRMFYNYETVVCKRCGGDGCVNTIELSYLANSNSYKSEEEIKTFQDWLDVNHPLWINDHGTWKNLRVGTESEPNRHLEGKGYGVSNKTTTDAFEQYGSEYYKTGACSLCNKNGTCSDELLK